MPENNYDSRFFAQRKNVTEYYDCSIAFDKLSQEQFVNPTRNTSIENQAVFLPELL